MEAPPLRDGSLVVHLHGKAIPYRGFLNAKFSQKNALHLRLSGRQEYLTVAVFLRLGLPGRSVGLSHITK